MTRPLGHTERSGQEPLLAEDKKPIKLVGEKVRKAWERRPKTGYSREQYEADKKRRQSRV